MQMFNPNQALPDFEAQAESAARQRLVADRLRKQAMASQQPEGRMVGRQFVNPHWLEQMIPLLNQYQAGAAERQAAGAEQESSNQQNQAANQWRQSMPQDIAPTQAVPAIPGDIDQRPDMPVGAEALAATPGNPMTRQRILQHTLAGLANPRTAKEAMLVNAGLTDDLKTKEARADKAIEREDLQNWKSAESEKARVQAAELKREALSNQLAIVEMQLADKTMTREMRERLEARQLDLMDQWKKATDATQRHIAGLVHAVGMAKADGKGTEKPTTESEKSSAGFLNRMRESEKVLQDPKVSKGKPSVLTKTVGAIPVAGNIVRPFTESAAQQRYRQAQEDWVRAKLRKESGATIPTDEMNKEIETYFPQPGETSKDLIAQKAASRKAAERQLEIGAGREAKNANMGGGKKDGITIEEVD
jgi:hypothetical protein